MTLRILSYRAFVTLDAGDVALAVERENAQAELDAFVPASQQDAVTWRDGLHPDGHCHEIAWSIRMDDHDLLAPLDD